MLYSYANPYLEPSSQMRMRPADQCDPSTDAHNWSEHSSRGPIHPTKRGGKRAKGAIWLYVQLLQGQPTGGGAEDSDHGDAHEHRCADECRDGGHAAGGKQGTGDEAGKGGGHSAPGVDEADRARSDAGGEQFRLIAMIGIRHDVGGEGEGDSDQDEQRRGRCVGEGSHQQSHGGEAASGLEPALDGIGKETPYQRPYGLSDGNDEGVLQSVGNGDAAGDEQRRHPGIEAVEADDLGGVEYGAHDGAGAIFAVKTSPN